MSNEYYKKLALKYIGAKNISFFFFWYCLEIVWDFLKCLNCFWFVIWFSGYFFLDSNNGGKSSKIDHGI